MNAKIDVIAEACRKSSNGCIPIVLRLSKDRKRKIIRLGVNVNPDHWDATKNKIKPSCPDYGYLENIITERKSKSQKQVLEFQSIGKDYSLTQLANAVE
ncbi:MULTISPECIES: Arm DNA-binding domain-containing protein [unclassified Dysgonomonas]|uniref:Arm DNA-binding domain-containing protein n=1 Tax=unclassified Dysgonomonas TaxID=2630389 RepID=UPI0038B284D8